MAVLGISFDGSIAEAREAFAFSGSNGPVAFVPNNSLTRRLWRDGTMITRLPLVYVLDREGVLRFVCNSPFVLQDQVDIVLGRAKRPVVHTVVGPIFSRPPTTVLKARPAEPAPSAPKPKN